MSRPYYLRESIKPVIRLIETMGDTDNSPTNPNQTNEIESNETNSLTSQRTDNPVFDNLDMPNDNIPDRIETLEERLIYIRPLIKEYYKPRTPC